jgi:predicted PurR-regulated permease PerM
MAESHEPDKLVRGDNQKHDTGDTAPTGEGVRFSNGTSRKKYVLMGHRPPDNMILWFFLSLFLASIFILGWLIWPFISIIIMAAVLTGVFSPIYTLFLKKRMKASVASVLTCVLVFIVLFIPIVLFVGILSKEAYDLYLMAKTAVLREEIRALFEKSRILEQTNLLLSRFDFRLSGEELNRAISEVGKSVGLFLYGQASAIASNIFKFVLNFFFMLLIMYFLFIDGDRIVSFIMDLSPLPADQDQQIIQKFKDMAGAILVVNSLSGIAQGVFGGIVFAFFGLKSPFMWGLIMAILAFLPILGIGIVFIPTAVYLLLNGRFPAAVFFVVSYVLVTVGIENLLKPKLVGQRVKMHVLLVFLSIMGGLKLFGILGIVYGPLVVTAFITLTDIYHTSYQKLVEPSEG